MEVNQSSIKMRDITLCALFTGMIVIVSQLSIPLAAGVPFTLQTLGMALAAILLGAKRGFISTLIYILLGAVGLPVFAGYTGGIQHIFGSTGGYIISFPVMAYMIGYVSEKTDHKFWVFTGVTLALVFNLVCGMFMFSVIMEASLYQSFAACVLPFVPFSIVKAVIATALGLKIKATGGMKL